MDESGEEVSSVVVSPMIQIMCCHLFVTRSHLVEPISRPKEWSQAEFFDVDGQKKTRPQGYHFEGSDHIWPFLWPHPLRPIHPMPYVLRYDSDASTGAPNMKVSRASSEARVVQYGDAETNGADKIRYYFSPFVSEFLVDDFRWFQNVSDMIGAYRIWWTSFFAAFVLLSTMIFAMLIPNDP